MARGGQTAGRKPGFVKTNGKTTGWRAHSITLAGPDGRPVRFDSRSEAAYVVSLWLDPDVRVVELQPRYIIHVPGPNGPVQVGSCRADVAWIRISTDAHYVDDVKGWMDSGKRDALHFRLRCVAAEHGVEIRLVKPYAQKQVTRLIALWTAGLGMRGRAA